MKAVLIVFYALLIVLYFNIGHSASWHGVDLPVNLKVHINQQDSTAIVSRGEEVFIDFQANRKNLHQQPLDWWILAGSLQFGWYWYEKNSQTFGQEANVASQQLLFNDGELLRLSGLNDLPVDTYTIYFGADTVANGVLDEWAIGYSEMLLHMVDKKSRQFDYQSDFSQDLDAWQAGVADLPVAYDAEIYALAYEYASMPAGVSADIKKAAMLQGHNRSDDLFMYIYRPLTGLKHHTAYAVSFQVEIASNAMTGEFGIGGAPGESVYFKAGVSSQRPQVEVASDRYYRLNWDHGKQSSDGSDAVVLGHIGVDIVNSEYKIKTLNNNNKTFEFTTGPNDRVWLLLGVDSGFEGLTRLYVPKISIRIKELAESRISLF